MQVNQQYVNPEFHKLLLADPGFRAVLERIGHGAETRVTGLKGSSKALLVAALHGLTRRMVVVLCAGLDEAGALA